MACALSCSALCKSARTSTSETLSTVRLEHSASSHITFNLSNAYYTTPPSNNNQSHQSAATHQCKSQLKKQGLGISALDSVFKAIVLNKIMYALPVYFGYLTEGQRHMLQRVLHRASSRGFTPFYYYLDTLAENAHYHLFKHSCRKDHCLYHLYSVKPRPPGDMRLRTHGHDFELPIIKYEFNKRNFIVQSLFNYVWFCVLLYYLHFVFYCTHVRMSYVLNSYLLTYI